MDRCRNRRRVQDGFMMLQIIYYTPVLIISLWETMGGSAKLMTMPTVKLYSIPTPLPLLHLLVILQQSSHAQSLCSQLSPGWAGSGRATLSASCPIIYTDLATSDAQSPTIVWQFSQ